MDTDVLIDHEKGIAHAGDFLQKINRTENQLFLSVITLIELFTGLSEEDRKRSDPLISLFDVIVVDREIGEKAAAYLHRFQKRSGVGLGDAVIAATAHSLRATIITRNQKHFPMSDIQVLSPYR